MLTNILSEKHRQIFIVKELLNRVIEINAALQDFSEELLRYQDYMNEDFYEKKSKLEERLNGLTEQTHYLISDDNINDVNQRADEYINTMIAELKARAIAVRNQKDAAIRKLTTNKIVAQAVHSRHKNTKMPIVIKCGMRNAIQ